MKAALVLLALALSFSVTCVVQAQPPAGKKGGQKGGQKSEADIALEQFFKTRDAATAKPDQPNFQKLLAAGFDFLGKQPKHARAGNVIGALGAFGGTLKDKSQAAMRGYWVASIRYEILNRKGNEALDDDGRAAIAAVDAAVADYEVRSAMSRPNLAAFREKIDALTQLPGSVRFLRDQELSYIEVLESIEPKSLDAHLQRLVEHPEPTVAKMLASRSILQRRARRQWRSSSPRSMARRSTWRSPAARWSRWYFGRPAMEDRRPCYPT